MSYRFNNPDNFTSPSKVRYPVKIKTVFVPATSEKRKIPMNPIHGEMKKTEYNSVRVNEEGHYEESFNCSTAPSDPAESIHANNFPIHGGDSGSPDKVENSTSPSKEVLHLHLQKSPVVRNESKPVYSIDDYFTQNDDQSNKPINETSLIEKQIPHSEGVRTNTTIPATEQRKGYKLDHHLHHPTGIKNTKPIPSHWVQVKVPHSGGFHTCTMIPANEQVQDGEYVYDHQQPTGEKDIAIQQDQSGPVEIELDPEEDLFGEFFYRPENSSHGLDNDAEKFD